MKKGIQEETKSAKTDGEPVENLKLRKKIIIFAVFGGLILIGFIIVLVFVLKGEIIDSDASGNSKVVYNEESDDYELYESQEEEIEAILKKIRGEFTDDELDSKNREIHYSLNGESTDSGVYHKINDDGTLHQLGKSLTLGYSFEDTKANDFQERAIRVLSSIGFVKYTTNEEDNLYVNEKIICNVEKSSVSCGNDDWDSSKGTIAVVVKAYKSSTGKTLKRVVGSGESDPRINENVDENGYGYQTMSIMADDSEGNYRAFFFYQKIKEYEMPLDWVYAFSSDPLGEPGDPYIHFSCSVFEDEDIKNAFDDDITGGRWCDDENGKRVKIEL